jgi:PII-like signaling protein
MPPGRRAKELRIFVSETDKIEGRPLYEAIVERCRELEIAGATVTRGVKGYGEKGGMHEAHLLRHDRPVVIVVVDEAEKVAKLAAAVEGMIDTGLMMEAEVEVKRVMKPAGGRG